MIRFFAKGRCAHCVSDDKLTKGSVGIEVRFYLEDWDAAPNRVVVFRAGSTKVDVALLTDRCTVPPEVLNNPGDMLVIGVYGTDNDSNIVIPTVYADAGRVRLGASPSGIEPTPTTQPLIDQLLAAAEEAERVAQSVRDDADNGSFDGSDGVSPTISSESITGGHLLTIVDAGGTTTVDVMDGEDGADGVGVPSGGAAGDVLRKASGTDYDTEWHSPEIFWAVYDSTTADEIETARIAGKAIMCAWGGKTYVMNYRQNATKFYFTAADRNALYHISVSGSSWSNVSTKTVGTYSKPSGGIPASDLVSGISVPPSGSTGQVLKKASGSDYDTVWANESGGGGTGDYSDLTNKPQINSVTLSGNKSLSDLGAEPEAMVVTVTDSVGGPSTDYGFTEIKAAADAGKRVVAVYENCIYSLYTVDVPSRTAVFTSVFQSLSHVIVIVNQGVHSVGTVYNYIKPSGGIPKTDLASAVQTSLGKADTALQSAPVTSVNGQTGAVSLSIPSTASDVGAVASNQGVSNANKVLTVNPSGVVVPEDNRFVVTLTPTSPDYSGTMDKTPNEITDAIGAGKRIMLDIPALGASVEATQFISNSGDTCACANVIYFIQGIGDALIQVITHPGPAPQGVNGEYGTTIYPLATGQWTGGSY